MSNALAAAVAGGSVGLAVAVPLGPVGLAVVASGQRGWRAGVAAAGGVATADVIWAVVAAAGGAAVAGHPAIEAGRVAARVLLVALGAWLLVSGLRRLRNQAAAAALGRIAALSPFRRYLAMLAVTLPNPLTVAVFAAAAVETGLAARSGSGYLMAIFVVAVGIASLCWQLLLAVAGRGLAMRATPAASAWLSIGAGAFLIAWPLLN